MKVSEIVHAVSGRRVDTAQTGGFGGRRSGWAWGGQRNPWWAGIPLGEPPTRRRWATLSHATWLRRCA